MYKMRTEGGTVDERPDEEGNNVGNSKGNLGEIEVEGSDSESRSEGQDPVSVHDNEGKTCNRGIAPGYPIIRLDVRRFLLTGE